MKKIYNFGIIGCGMIANFHKEAISEIGNATLRGVTDVNVEGAKKFAEKEGCIAYESYDKMLEDECIDVVCVCTPSAFHESGAVSALKHGKHVVLEKPMAITREGVQNIIKASEESGCFITIISQMRFSDSIQKAKKLIEDGAFGKLLSCDLHMKYWREPKYYTQSPWKGTWRFDGGGALMNQGIHGIDVMQYLVGKPKVLSSKIKTQLHDIETEDTAIAICEYPSGAIGVIEGTTCIKPGFDRKIEICGSEGCIILKEDNIELLYIGGEKIHVDKIGNTISASSDPAAFSASLHRKQIKNLIDAIEGKENILIDAHEGKKAVEIILDIYDKTN